MILAPVIVELFCIFPRLDFTEHLEGFLRQNIKCQQGFPGYVNNRCLLLSSYRASLLGWFASWSVDPVADRQRCFTQ